MSMELFYKFSRIRKFGVRFNGPKNVTENYSSVIFKLYSSYILYSTVITSWSGYLREHNDYPTILLNNNWIIKPSLIINNEGLHVSTCKYHNNGESKLTLVSPESPYNHILNAKISDQLAHCVKIPRISKQMKAMKYCTKFAMVQSHSGFTGVDTMNITSRSDFSKTSCLLLQHKNASIIGRNDI